MRYLVCDITHCHIPEELISYLRTVYKSVCKVTSLENAYGSLRKHWKYKRIFSISNVFSYESFPISHFLP